MSRKAAFLYDDVLSEHTLREDHPMRPVRLRYTYELLASYGAFERPHSRLVRPRRATEEEVLTFHSRDYVRAVKGLSHGEPGYDPGTFNFSQMGDNPIYPGMFNAAMWSTGASITAAELVERGEADAAFNVSGGLHHAMPSGASGFCIFNDPVIAINALLKKGARIAYVDIDAHHGDGVQHAFYHTDAVLTISLHESGQYLFPGTGSVDEIGAGRGRGYSVNVPFYPFTNDEIYLWAFKETVSPLIKAFRPHFVFTQLGIDTHFRDPITHMALTIQGFTEAVRELSALAPSGWIAMGGGGYDLMAVARAWTRAYGVISQQTFPDHIPEGFQEWYGVATLNDQEGPQTAEDVLHQARQFAEKSVLAVHRTVFPTHGLR